ncbi:MAG: Adenosine deaminase [Lachnoclostridium sp.]|jgi:adenosine deaminase
MDQGWLSILPKIDLHCHLDGSMDTETVHDLLAERGIYKSIRQLQNELLVSDDCVSLKEYLKTFDLPLFCLQTEKGLKQAAVNLLKNAANENVKYIEVRFAPMSCVREGLSCKQVIESVLSGIETGKQLYNIEASVIVCAMRHDTMEDNLLMLKCAREYLGTGVCGLDLAGDEKAYPTSGFRELFKKARELKMPFTIHSGECGSIENVREAVAFGAKRLGHGIALAMDPSLMEICKEKRIGIEMCPTSNFQTKAVTSWEEYPLLTFMDYGLPVTVNTDNRTVSNTSMTKELLTVSKNLELNKEQIIKLLRNSIEISFAEDNVKDRLLKEMGY